MAVSAPVPEQRQVLTVYHPMEGLEGVGEGTTLEVIVTEDLLAPSCEKKPKKDDTLGEILIYLNCPCG